MNLDDTGPAGRWQERASLSRASGRENGQLGVEIRKGELLINDQRSCCLPRVQDPLHSGYCGWLEKKRVFPRDSFPVLLRFPIMGRYYFYNQEK